jgi:dolichol kinase
VTVMGDVTAVAASSGVFVGLLAGAEASSRRWKLGAEAARKTAHLAAGLVAAALPLFMSFPAVAVLSLLFVPFMLVSRRLDLFPAVHGVERSTLGETYFPLGVCLAALAFPHHAPFAFGVLVMGLADAAAGVAGQRYGHRAYRLFTAWKTYAGSGAFFATTLVLAVAFAPAPAAIAVAAALTLAEAAFGGGTDNLVLPVAAAGLLTLVG